MSGRHDFPSTVGAFEHRWRQSFEWRAQTFSTPAEIHGGSQRKEVRTYRAVVALLDSLPFAPDPLALDLGCGLGRFGRVLRERGCGVLALDYSIPTLARATRWSSVHYAAAEAYYLPVADARFDVVLCIGVFYVLLDPGRALAEITRVLRPGGLLIMEALNRRSLKFAIARSWYGVTRQKFPVRAYRAAEIRTAVDRCGLRLIREQRVSHSLAHELLFVAQKPR